MEDRVGLVETGLRNRTELGFVHRAVFRAVLPGFFLPLGANAVASFGVRRGQPRLRVGDLPFLPADVVVLFVPKETHEDIRGVLAEYAPNLSRSRRQAFTRIRNSKLIDATWGLDQIIGTFARVEDLGPFPIRD